RFAPSQGQYKVYVIDEAHQLTTEAFNALLKTLEEPPPHAMFILATTESQKIPATIVSRTQRFDLRRIPHKGVIAQLAKIVEQENIRADAAALDAIARQAQGSLRDAESMLDMVIAFANGPITLKEVDDLLGASDWEETAALFDALAAADGARGVELIGRLVDEGRAAAGRAAGDRTSYCDAPERSSDAPSRTAARCDAWIGRRHCRAPRPHRDHDHRRRRVTGREARDRAKSLGRARRACEREKH